MRLQNTILVGVTGAGKTKIAKELVKHGYILYDTDKIFEAAYKTNIVEFFKRYGENEFRYCEREVIDSLKKTRGAVIVVGGGAALSVHNMENLKKLGKIVHITRSAEEPDKRAGQSGDCVKADKEICKGLYCEWADEIIDSDNLTPQEIAELIIRSTT